MGLGAGMGRWESVKGKEFPHEKYLCIHVYIRYMETQLMVEIILGLVILIFVIIIVIVVNVSQTAVQTTDQRAVQPSGTTGREYVFHQGVDSSGNDISQLADYANQITDLKSKCDQTPKCAGFNTKGWLKHTINPPATWTKWSPDPDHGLYVAVPEK